MASVVTHDPSVARQVVLGLAPWHGRVLVLDRDAAGESTGHGTPAARAGPRRSRPRRRRRGAGRRPRPCCTTCSAPPCRAPPTCSPPSRARGRRARSATTTAPACTRSARASPSCASATPSPRQTRTVTLADIEHFAEFTGDTFYAHTDQAAAEKNPLFGGIVAHGYLVVSLAAGLFVDPDPGPVLANFGVDHLRFLTPGQGRRHDLGLPDRQADHPARLRRLRRGALGRRRGQRGRRTRRHLRRADPGGQDLA